MSSPHLSSGGESDTLLSEFRRELDAFYVSAESMVITQCHQPAQGNYIEAQAWCVSVNQGFTSRTPITLRLTAVPRDGEPDPKSGVSVRYRVVVDRTRCGGDFRLSRQASYMDPISGSVMPTAFDNVIFPTLRSFIDDGIRRLFEQKPPLMDYGSVANNAAATILTTFPPTVELNNVAAFQHIFQDASKTDASARDVNREYELRTFAVLRDLSKFGDGLSRYDPSLGIIRVHIPIFNTKQATTRSGQPMSTEGSPLGVNSTSSTSVTDVEVLTTLRVCIRLQINADAVPPPTVYLVDAAGGSLHRDWSLGFGPSTPPTAEECQYMEHLFVPLLELESDARTLRVRPSLVAQWWQPEASVYQLLQQLQAEITSLLRKASTQSNDMDDWFATFNSPVTAAPKPFVRIGTMDKCLLCGSQPKSVAFVPCGHIAMCRSCARRMMVEKNQSAPFRSREPTGANMFPCVVCKTMVQECRLLL